MSEIEDLLTWKKSAASMTGNCVEVASIDDSVFVRDSKDPKGAKLTFSRPEWLSFLTDVRDGKLDSQ